MAKKKNGKKNNTGKNKKQKKQLTQQEEFEIMKLVLDKFLWLGVIIMGYGFYSLVSKSFTNEGVYFVIAGIVVLLLFIVLLVREYELVR